MPQFFPSLMVWTRTDADAARIAKIVFDSEETALNTKAMASTSKAERDALTTIELKDREEKIQEQRS